MTKLIKNIRNYIDALTKRCNQLPNIALNRMCNVLPEWLYLTLKFRMKMGTWPNILHPRTFNEKLQWLKIYDHNPAYTEMVDKYRAKEWAANKIGKEYIIPTLGVWKTSDKIDFTQLPNKFVLKVTHGGGGNGVIICRDIKSFNQVEACKNLNRAMKLDLYKYNREWPYKNVPRRIIAETLLFDESIPNEMTNDYKFYCFDGKMQFMLISHERKNKHAKFNYFDRNFNPLPFKQGGEKYDGIIEKPSNFELMISLSEKLSAGIPHVRVDFYDVNGKVYFGEMTFFDSSGFAPFDPEEWDYKYGEMINLPSKRK